MAPIPGLQPRERRLAVAAAAIICCWVLVSWVVQPLWDHLHDLRLQVETQTEKLNVFSQLLEQAPTIERQYAAIMPYLASGDDEENRGALLGELEELSRSAGLQLSLKPSKPPTQGERMDRFEIELDVEGSQTQLLGFLDALFRLPRLLSIERLRIATVPTKADVLRANMVLEQLTVRQGARKKGS